MSESRNGKRRDKITSVDSLGNNEYRYTEQVKNTEGNFEKVEDFKFEVVEKGGSLAAARQSIVEETIHMTLNLKPQNAIRIIEKDEEKDSRE